MSATTGVCRGFLENRPTRREALRAGALTFAGLGLPALLRSRAEAARADVARGPGFGRARSCILIFQWGGPSQLDTWDPKPDAPTEVRGEFQPIATRTPGLFLSEHFPLLAQRTDRLTVVRSMSHDDPAHLSTAHRVLTGHLAPTPFSDAAGPSPRDWPHLGAIVAKVRPSRGVLPSSVTMPWTVAHPAAPGGRAPGQDAGWLGKSYEPFRVEGDPNAPDFRVTGLDLPEGVSPDRMQRRRSLLARSAGTPAPSSSWDAFQARALDTLTAAETRGAFDIHREDPRTRDRYGRHIHGQCLLLARRLVEAGVGLITANWHDDGQNFWDTHSNNFNRLKNDLMPPSDRAFAALLDDLGARGLLDETLVVWVGEFGRNPRITAGNAGREHWPRCYSAALAGAGIAGGRVHGASDRWAAYPARDPVSPDDLGATILHALGIDPSQELTDPVGRPLRVNTGTPLASLFS
ncbi:MAG TPA: DUF1501 domain-containing protein [Isosphaeraceae bacterium]|jgi:hypothetical protein|nr:DUF1501 domain-containing protein [Isosphaeraceae bacterium]